MKKIISLILDFIETAFNILKVIKGFVDFTGNLFQNCLLFIEAVTAAGNFIQRLVEAADCQLQRLQI